VGLELERAVTADEAAHHGVAREVAMGHRHDSFAITAKHLRPGDFSVCRSYTSDMDAADLRIFEAVAQLGGMTRAAAELHTVPSNVTARIRVLEEELGVRLMGGRSDRPREGAAASRERRTS
jgi:hypothetical protein